MIATFASVLPDEAEVNLPCCLFSKAEFLDAIETMAGKFTAEPLGDDLESVFLSCSYDTWRRTFGGPQDMQEFREADPDPPVEVWEQPCSDGVVRCVGYLVDDPHDGKWVILTRVCLF